MKKFCSLVVIKGFLSLTLSMSSVSDAQDINGTVLKNLFSDSLSIGVQSWAYPGRTAISSIKDGDKKRGNVLSIQFDDKLHSGAEVVLNKDNAVDLCKIRNTAVVSFYIKGLQGGEQINVSLMDNGIQGNNKCEVKVQSINHFEITGKWQQVIIPLSAFPDEGERWFEKLKGGEYARIDWSRISTVKFSTAKEQNFGRSAERLATVFIDEIEFVSGIKDVPVPKMLSWKLLQDTTVGPLVPEPDADNLLFSFFGNKMGEKTSVYNYGGTTDFSVKDSKDSSRLPVFAGYFDDAEWSGITIHKAQNNPIDLTAFKETGGLEFNVKGVYGDELFVIGLLDDESDGIDMKVQTRLHSRTYIKVTKEWQTVQIPFSDFSDAGKWWSTDGHFEALGFMNWSKITEVRFSTEKLANKVMSKNGKQPVRLYFSDIKFVKKMDTFSMARFWKEFKSEEPDLLIDDFESTFSVEKWVSKFCPFSTMKVCTDDNSDNKSNAIRIDYRIQSWGSSTCPIDSVDSTKFDWSHHNALKFNFYSSERVQTCMVLIVDGSHEAWFAHFEAKKGWQEISVPFSEFRMFEWWQPDSVVVNRKMDMGRIYSYDFRPGTFGKKGVIMLDNLRLTNTFIPRTEKTNSLKYNQIGYYSNSIKHFIVADSSIEDFGIIDEKGELVYGDKLYPIGFWQQSGEYVKVGDFSEIIKPGRYQLLIQQTGEKSEIFIRDSLYKDPLKAAMKAFYFQRLSTELKKENAGEWARNAGIPDTACSLHVSTGKSGVINASGGWMDAGDYGKYIVNAGITVGTLLGIYELLPDCIDDNQNIPESNNGVSDLLDEVKYELDWMKKMQDSDGGVFFKLGSLEWDGFTMPEDVKSVRYVIGKSTASALNFSAVMAMAARIYTFDKPYSKDCLKRSIAAWKWAVNNSLVREPNEVGGTGPYDDATYEDEFFWAACELFTTTKKSSYRKYIENNASSFLPATAADYRNVSNLGWYTLVTHFSDSKYPFIADGSRSIISLANQYVKNIDSIPYRIPLEDFVWGSNSVFLNHAIVMCYAYQLTSQNKYIESVIETADYIFGKNGVGISYVTGFGKESPIQPHHRVMSPDGVEAPFPGFLVGGANGDKQDVVAHEPGVNYPFKEPARAYTDRMAAYACNEVAINWNAALVFVLGFLNGNMK